MRSVSHGLFPIVGGRFDSVIGILAGTGFGIAPQRAALFLS
jgi:hypothetical protein